MVIIVLYLFICLLVLFTVIKLLFWRQRFFLSNAKSLDTPVHQGSTENTTSNQGQMQWSPPKTG
jgi:hypothetical protein